MGRIRTIKPEFFTSHDIASVTPLARLFYAFLWTESDRNGLLEWKPKNFAMRFFPLEHCDIDALGEELSDQGVIVLHECGVCEIPGFLTHQVINNRETQSVLISRVKDACTRVLGEGRKEGKGKEQRVKDAIGFDAFWEAWPKKVDKKKAETAWNRLTVEKQKRAMADFPSRYSDTDAQFIPNPTTYIHGERWDDQTRKSEPANTYGGEVWK